jgi:hypothetical protein
VLVLLAYVGGFFSLWIQVDPFAGGGVALPLVSAGSGVAFAVAAWSVADAGPPRGFALVGAGVCAAALAIAAIVAVYG